MIVYGPGEYEIQGFYIRGVCTTPGTEETPDNKAYMIHVEGLTLCHLGDLAHPLACSASG